MVNNCSLEVDKAIWEEFVCLPSLYLWYLKCLHFFFQRTIMTLIVLYVAEEFQWRTTEILVKRLVCWAQWKNLFQISFLRLFLIFLLLGILILFLCPQGILGYSPGPQICVWKIWICKFYVCMCVRPCFTFIIIMWSQMRAISNTLFATECNFACQQT